MATIRKASVDDAGTVLAYIDSGAPPGDSYGTVVLVHGHSYNSQTFARLLPLAASYNLRVIALNRRDYADSTPFSDADMVVLFSSNVEGHKKFLRARGLEIARFFAWIIDELKIPRARLQNEGGRKGGLALLGWSLGSVTTLAFLRNLSSFPNELIKKLEPYLKTFIMYDSGYATLGYPHPPGMYHPFRDASVSVEERKAAFNAWISSYYVHPYYASTTISPASRTLESLVLRMEALGPKSDSVSTEIQAGVSPKPASYANIDPDAFASAAETHPERSEMAFHGTVRADTLYDQLASALFFPSSDSSGLISGPSNEGEASALSRPCIPLPKVQVLYIYGTRSPWTTQWCSWALEADINYHSNETRRPVELLRVEGGNHFLHWDDPDKFLAILAEKSN